MLETAGNSWKLLIDFALTFSQSCTGRERYHLTQVSSGEDTLTPACWATGCLS